MSFVVRHDTEGPKVRFGVAWFAISVGACVVAPLLLALVMSVAAALAADQLVRLHDTSQSSPILEDPLRLLAMLGAGALPLAASQGVDTLAGAMAATALVALVASLGRPSDPPAVVQSLPLLAILPVGLAAASPVLLQRLGMAAALFLLVLIAAYDAGDYLIGTAADTAWEGPAAGVAAIVVVGFAEVVVAPPPLQEAGAVTLALVVALFAPLGPPLASVLIGDGATRASFVRRLDSLLLAGPIAAYALAARLPSL